MILKTAVSRNEKEPLPVFVSWMKALPLTSRYSLMTWPPENPPPVGLKTQLLRTGPAFAAPAIDRATAEAQMSFLKAFIVSFP
ncbi:MAG TPA: hypothetical protein DDX04_16210 [Massilia sp.]|nr:hypothetical protein [Massilia sp.]